MKAADAAHAADPFERKLRVLVADGAVPAALAKDLLAAHAEALVARPGEMS